jgi:lysyl-tRNA synthetase class I
LRETFTDRSQRILKTRALNNDASMRRMDEMTKLRQTVSNATNWQYRTMTPSSTLRPMPEEQKKGELEYSEAKKELKSKFASKQHSRNNSRT